MIGVESNLFSNNIIDQGRHAAAAPPSASLALLCLTVARPAPLYCTVQAAQCSVGLLYTMNVLTSTGQQMGEGHFM